MEKLSTDHPLWDQRDQSGYVRFVSALIFDDTREHVRNRFSKLLFTSKTVTGSSIKTNLEYDLSSKIMHSFVDGTFIEEYFENKEQYLSKKAIRKFF